jgi:uncharacterized membrane protein YcjF (UPF0283 family)
LGLATTAVALVVSLILVAALLVRMIRERKRMEQLRDRNYFKRLDSRDGK